MQKHHYATKTEFIREAIRDKVRQLQALEGLAQTRGASKHTTTDAQLHAAREEIFDSL